MSDEDDTITIRGGGSWYRKSVTPEEAAELRQLYDELQDVTTAGGEALGTLGTPEGMALQRFLENNARVLELVERIKLVLG